MNEMGPIGKLMMAGGAALFLIGVAFAYGSKYIPIGRLPGDISFRRGNFSFFFPVVTCILISVILSIIMNLFSRR